MYLQFGSHGWGTEEEISTPETNIVCENCGEKMIVTYGCGIIHSGYNKFTAECPNCKAKQQFSDYELFKQCWHKGLEIRSKKVEENIRNYEKILAEKSKEFELKPFITDLLEPDKSLDFSERTYDDFLNNFCKVKNDIMFLTFTETDINENPTYYRFIFSKNANFVIRDKRQIDDFGNLLSKSVSIGRINDSSEFMNDFLKLIYLTDGKIIKKKDDEFEFKSIWKRIIPSFLHHYTTFTDNLFEGLTSSSLRLFLYRRLKNIDITKNIDEILQTKEKKWELQKILRIDITKDEIFEKFLELISDKLPSKDTEELYKRAEKLLTEENRYNLMYNTTEEITEKFFDEKKS